MAYEELIRGIKNGDVNSKDELYTKVKGLIYKEVNTFYNRNRDFLKKCGYMDYEDLVQIGNLIFTKSINKYKLNKGYEFSTYLVQSIRNYLNVYFFPNKTISKDYKANADTLELNEKIIDDNSSCNMIDNLHLKIALEKLTHEERELIYDKFFRGLSSKEMVNKYGVSCVTIRKRREKALEKLKRYMED